MVQNALKQKWQNNEGSALCAWLATACPITAELYARAPYDAICIDLQHGLFDFSEALHILQCVSGLDVTPIVRVADHNGAAMQKVLDAGAYGIICPMVNTAEQCADLVRSVKYPPRGERSFGPNRAVICAGNDYVKQANNEIVVFAMVETTQSLQNLEAIIDTEGLDGIFIGPADLSMSLENHFSGSLSAAVVAHIDRIIDLCNAQGKYTGIACPNIEIARRFRAKGCQLISIANNVRFLRAAIQNFFVEWENQ